MSNNLKPNAIGTESDSLFSSNWAIRLTEGGGPTGSTGFRNGLVPSENGYAIYGPGAQVRLAADDTELLETISKLGGDASSVSSALAWARSNNILVTNRDYENIATDGLIFNLDAGFTPSYPKSGNIWYNLNGNINATLMNGPTFNSTNGGNINFDGSNDYVATTFKTNEHFTSGQAWTVSMMLKLPAAAYGKGLITNQNFKSVPNSGGFGIMFFPTNKVSVFLTKSNGDGTQDTYQGVCPVTQVVNQWWHLTYTFSDGTLSGFTNGVLQSSAYSAGYTWTTSGINMLINLSTQGGWGGYSAADIAIVQVYNRALSATEILQNYNAQRSRFEIITEGLILNLDASNSNSYQNGVSGTTWADISGNDNDATLVNGPTFNSTNGTNSIVFDGTDDYASLSDSLLLTDTTPFTSNTWIKPSTGILTNTYAVIFTLKAVSTHWQISYSSDPTYNLLFSFAGTSTSVGTISSVTSLIPLDTWGLVSVQYNGGDKSLLSSWKVYINGAEVAIRLTGYTGASTNTNSLGFRPGRGGISNNYFKGNISNHLIYNRALSAAEILQNFNAQKSRFGL